MLLSQGSAHETRTQYEKKHGSSGGEDLNARLERASHQGVVSSSSSSAQRSSHKLGGVLIRGAMRGLRNHAVLAEEANYADPLVPQSGWLAQRGMYDRLEEGSPHLGLGIVTMSRFAVTAYAAVGMLLWALV